MGEAAVQLGDTVCFHIGGPEMTVEGIEGGLAVCVWFAGKEPKQRELDGMALRKLKP